MMNYHQKWLQPLEAKGRLRQLTLPRGIDFASNDYLGMSAHPKLRAAAIKALTDGLEIGAGGSRLLRGHHPAHAALEEMAAAHFSCEKTLYFANGFMANTALLTTLPQRNDVVLYDELVHASMRDGLHAGQAQKVKIPHNNLNAFAEALARFSGGGRQLWVAIESVYSMDGDIAPVAEIVRLAREYEAIVMVDEAHATGIFGANGKGVTEGLDYKNLIVLHTCGKAIGVAGGLVCGEAAMIDTLINCARSFIYSTAPMPLQAHLVMSALAILEAEPGRRHKLLELCAYARKLLPEYANASQIMPVILGSNTEALRMAQLMQAQGLDVRAVRPPTVPEGTARLRLSLNIGLTHKNLEDFSSLLRINLLKEAS
jgi:8-amino-7-oxononanoate synthase